MAESDTKSSTAINWSIVIPAIAAIIAALIALLSNIYATYITGANQITLEQQRLRENLILEFVKTGDRNKAIANLQFFLDAGFIDDPGGKILSLIKEKKSPVLPSSVIGVVTDCMAQCGVRMNLAYPADATVAAKNECMTAWMQTCQTICGGGEPPVIGEKTKPPGTSH